jgi:hypothetical protein
MGDWRAILDISSPLDAAVKPNRKTAFLQLSKR